MAAPRYATLRLYRRLFWHARPYWAHIAALFFLSLLATPVALLAPLPLKIAADSVVGAHPLPGFLAALLPESIAQSQDAMIFVVAALVVTITLLGLVQHLATHLLTTYAGEKLVLHFRAQLFSHVQRLSLTYHDLRGVTDSAYRIQHDAPAIQMIMLKGLIPLANAAMTLVGMIYITARIDLRLALVALAVMPVFLALTWHYGGRLRTRWRHAKDIESSAFSVVQEVLSSLRLVKSFRREEYEQRRFTRHSSEGVAARTRATLSEGVFGLLVGMTTAGGMAAVLFVGLHAVRHGTLSLGDLLLVAGYLGQLYGPLKRIGKEAGGTRQRALASAERALALLDEQPEVTELPNARPLTRARGHVRFENVCFSYDSERQVLQDVSFDVPAGTWVGIQGKTGAGKSTLMNLLLRFYDPASGRVLLDGLDLRECRLADLRNQFALVLQEPVLFSTTIAENIAYGRPGVSEAEVIAAARAAHAHEFITRLSDGYQTQVGERGACLSGGERQRIALARAFLKDAPVLILDEPTSAVDAKTEAAVIDAIRELARGRTTFTITHRLSAIQHCDMLLMVHDGRVSPARPLSSAATEPAMATGI